MTSATDSLKSDRLRIALAVLAGIAAGLTIFVCYAVGYGLTDGVWRK